MNKKLWKSIIALLVCASVIATAPAVYLPKDMEVYAAEEQADENGFVIKDGVLKKYIGTAEKVVIPEGVTEIGAEAFADCRNIKSISIPKEVTFIQGGSSMALYGKHVVSVKSTFSGCFQLQSIDVEEGNEYYVSYDGCLYEKYNDRWALRCCPAGKKQISFAENVYSIGNLAFIDCSELENLDIPDGVTRIDNYAFLHCRKLKDINIPESVIEIGKGVFWDTPWLGEEKSKNPLVIVNHILIDAAYCGNEMVIPEAVHSIGGMAFYDCQNLRSVDIPGSVAAIGEYAFANCGKLTSVNISEGVADIGNGAFSGCSSLAAISMPESMVTIGWSAFSGCSNLRNVYIPEGVTYISDNTFQGCNKITIYGVKDSCAQTYAAENGIPFVLLYIINLSEDVSSLSDLQMENIIAENKTQEVVIKNFERLTYTFEKDSMNLIDGKTSYDFGSKISEDYSNLVNPSFAKDEFAFQIDYNYVGQLPGEAKISIPVESKWIGKRLYYYEIDADGGYTYMGRSTVAEDGTYTVKQDHCSSYVAVTKVPEKLGDCDGEEGVNAKDALAVLKYSVGIPQEYFVPELADCDGEDGVNAKDALAILKFSVGIITEFE